MCLLEAFVRNLLVYRAVLTYLIYCSSGTAGISVRQLAYAGRRGFSPERSDQALSRASPLLPRNTVDTGNQGLSIHLTGNSSQPQNRTLRDLIASHSPATRDRHGVSRKPQDGACSGHHALQSHTSGDGPYRVSQVSHWVKQWLHIGMPRLQNHNLLFPCL
jgi:hypothetical protein